MALKSTTKYNIRETIAEKPIFTLAGVLLMLKNGATTTNMDMRVSINKKYSKFSKVKCILNIHF